MEGEGTVNRYPDMEGKWIARQALSSGSTRAKWRPEEKLVVEDVDSRSKTANKHGREVEGLKPDDAKFRKKKKNEPTHLAVQTRRRAVRRSQAGGVDVVDVGERASSTRAEEHHERGRAGRTR